MHRMHGFFFSFFFHPFLFLITCSFSYFYSTYYTTGTDDHDMTYLTSDEGVEEPEPATTSRGAGGDGKMTREEACESGCYPCDGRRKFRLSDIRVSGKVTGERSRAVTAPVFLQPSLHQTASKDLLIAARSSACCPWWLDSRAAVQLSRRHLRRAGWCWHRDVGSYFMLHFYFIFCSVVVSSTKKKLSNYSELCPRTDESQKRIGY